MTSNQKWLPWSSSLFTCSCPPMRCTKVLLITKPKPVPPKRRVVEVSACVNSSKICYMCSALIPMPVSITENYKCTSCSLRKTCSIKMRTCPCMVNFKALPARLIRICWSLNLSPIRLRGILGSISNINSTALFF